MRETIRLPKTSGRKAPLVWAKLLSAVRPNADNGFGFEGSVVRPGDTIAWDRLWPTPAHPPVPVLLEYAGCAAKTANGWRRHNLPDLYVLWRFDLARGIFVEVARAEGVAWSWAMDLRPIALRVMREAHGVAEITVYADFERTVARVDRFLGFALARLPERERGRALGILHDQLVGRIAAELPAA